jgi:3-oxoadipate CoA-transferase beta subunit
LLTTEQIAREIALDFPAQSYVNLGIGLPQTIARYVTADQQLVFHSENGVLGVGSPAAAGQEDPDLIDAGKLPVTLVPGGSYFSHADSFALIRGGHLDFCVLGGFQVSANGDLANWTDGRGIPAVGGAMDLAVGARRTVIMMRHNGRNGETKLVTACTLPLTAPRCVARVYTELGIFEPNGDHMLVLALTSGVGRDEVAGRSGVELAFANEVLQLPRSTAAPIAYRRLSTERVSSAR